MSHFSVLVIGENYEDQLRPYQENNMGDCPEEFMEFEPIDFKEEGYETMEAAIEDGYAEHEGQVGRWDNPNAKWDWYCLGGRWTGYFKLKSGAVGQTGTPGIMTPSAKEGFADQCRKGDIDIEWMRNDERERAESRYDKAMSIIAGESFKTWKNVVAECNEDYSKAREIYNNQPVLVRFRADDELGWNGPDEFVVPREEYVKEAMNGALSTFAIIKDGKWYERGKMGWWACVSDEKETDVWNAEFATMFNSLPDDTIISVVDCHI